MSYDFNKYNDILYLSYYIYIIKERGYRKMCELHAPSLFILITCNFKEFTTFNDNLIYQTIKCDLIFI